MGNADVSLEISLDQILEPVRRYWGFDRLRPLQEEAIRAGLTQRDSVVVMATGSGKSLCYQVPPVISGRTDVVVSPLISLMKDQGCGRVGIRPSRFIAAWSNGRVTKRWLAVAKDDFGSSSCLRRGC